MRDSTLSVDSEKALREALDGGMDLHSSLLLDALVTNGASRTRGAAMQLIRRGHMNGLLVRSGAKGSFRYALERDWTRPTARFIQDRTPATAYQGPAFGSGALVPSVGIAFAAHADDEGEVTPYHGGQILDALSRQFDSVFRNVE